MKCIVLLTQYFSSEPWWICWHFQASMLSLQNNEGLDPFEVMKVPWNAIYRHLNHGITFGAGLNMHRADSGKLKRIHTPTLDFLISYQLDYMTRKAFRLELTRLHLTRRRCFILFKSIKKPAPIRLRWEREFVWVLATLDLKFLLYHP